MSRFIFTSFFLLFTIYSSAATIYVHANATGNNNGTSWSNAYVDLQQALSAAIFNDEIWVASGTYYPTNDGNRDLSFVMKNTVSVYGGFAGTESAIDQRDIESNPTTLSGDIGQPGDNTDNSKKIVKIQNFTSDFVLDGFRIVSGFDNGGSGKGTALFTSNNSGADLTINNCLFFNNFGYHSGGAVIIDECNVTFNHCQFLFNSTFNNGGGAIYSANGADSNIYLYDCVFNGNNARDGAVIQFLGYDLVMDRCVITNNTATQGDIISIGNSDGYVTLRNTLMTGNSLEYYSASLISCYSSLDSALNIINSTICHNINTSSLGPYDMAVRIINGEMNIINSIIYGNTDDDNGLQVMPGHHVSHSIIEHGYAGGVNVYDTAPSYQSPSDLASAPFDVDGYDYTLASTSVGINQGDNAWIMGFPLDIANNVRIQQGTVDIGAYESSFADMINPVANCQNISLPLNPDGSLLLIPEVIDNGSTDNIGISSLILSQTEFSCADLGENSVILTVADGNNNTATCSAMVTIIDNTPPVAQLQNLDIYVDASGYASISSTDVDNGSFDQCGSVSILLGTEVFDCSMTGLNQVSVSLTDDAENETLEVIEVSVLDTIKPIAEAVDYTLYLQTSPITLLSPTDIDNGSSDNCDIANLSIDLSQFGCGDTGEHEVTLTVTDLSNNVHSTTATVTVIDTNTVNLVGQSVQLELDANGLAQLSAGQIDNGSSPGCGFVNMELDVTEFSCDELGSSPVVLTFNYADGTSSSIQEVVTVYDTTAPICSAQDITVDLALGNPYLISPSDIDAGTTDNCNFSQSLSITSFDTPGTYTVDLISTDGSGNMSICSADVTVTNSVGLNEIDGHEVRIFPNPTDNLLHMTYGEARIEAYMILDISGKVLRRGGLISTKSPLTLDIHDLAKGSYLLRLLGHDEQETHMLFQKH